MSNKYPIWDGSNQVYNTFSSVAGASAAMAIVLFHTSGIKDAVKTSLAFVPSRWRKFIDSGNTPYFRPMIVKIEQGKYIQIIDSSVQSDDFGLPIVDATRSLESFDVNIYRNYYSGAYFDPSRDINTVLMNGNHRSLTDREYKVKTYYDLIQNTVCVRVLGKSCMIVKPFSKDEIVIHRDNYNRFICDEYKRGDWRKQLIAHNTDAIKSASLLHGMNWLFTRLLSADPAVANESSSPAVANAINQKFYEPIYNEIVAIHNAIESDNKFAVIALALSGFLQSDHPLSFKTLDRSYTLGRYAKKVADNIDKIVDNATLVILKNGNATVADIYKAITKTDEYVLSFDKVQSGLHEGFPISKQVYDKVAVFYDTTKVDTVVSKIKQMLSGRASVAGNTRVSLLMKYLDNESKIRVNAYNAKIKQTIDMVKIVTKSLSKVDIALDHNLLTVNRIGEFNKWVPKSISSKPNTPTSVEVAKKPASLSNPTPDQIHIVSDPSPSIEKKPTDLSKNTDKQVSDIIALLNQMQLPLVRAQSTSAIVPRAAPPTTIHAPLHAPVVQPAAVVPTAPVAQPADVIPSFPVTQAAPMLAPTAIPKGPALIDLPPSSVLRRHTMLSQPSKVIAPAINKSKPQSVCAALISDLAKDISSAEEDQRKSLMIVQSYAQDMCRYIRGSKGDPDAATPDQIAARIQELKELKEKIKSRGLRSADELPDYIKHAPNYKSLINGTVDDASRHLIESTKDLVTGMEAKVQKLTKEMEDAQKTLSEREKAIVDLEKVGDAIDERAKVTQQWLRENNKLKRDIHTIEFQRNKMIEELSALQKKKKETELDLSVCSSKIPEMEEAVRVAKLRIGELEKAKTEMESKHATEVQTIKNAYDARMLQEKLAINAAKVDYISPEQLQILDQEHAIKLEQLESDHKKELREKLAKSDREARALIEQQESAIATLNNRLSEMKLNQSSVADLKSTIESQKTIITEAEAKAQELRQQLDAALKMPKSTHTDQEFAAIQRKLEERANAASELTEELGRMDDLRDKLGRYKSKVNTHSATIDKLTAHIKELEAKNKYLGDKAAATTAIAKQSEIYHIELLARDKLLEFTRLAHNGKTGLPIVMKQIDARMLDDMRAFMWLEQRDRTGIDEKLPKEHSMYRLMSYVAVIVRDNKDNNPFGTAGLFWQKIVILIKWLHAGMAPTHASILTRIEKEIDTRDLEDDWVSLALIKFFNACTSKVLPDISEVTFAGMVVGKPANVARKQKKLASEVVPTRSPVGQRGYNSGVAQDADSYDTR